MGPALGDLLQEVSDVAQLLQQRRQSGAAAAVCEKLTESLVASLQSAGPLGAASATKLYAAVETATFSDEEKQKLLCALDGAVGAEDVKAPSAAVVKQQTLEALQNYLTQSDWDALASAHASYAAKSSIVAKRLRSLGLRSLGEQTVKRAVALLLTTLPSLPPYTDIYRMVVDFKEVFHSCGAPPASLPFLRLYPLHPKDLPKLLFDSAYADAAPTSREVESLEQLATHHVPLRATSRLLTRQPRVAQAPAGTSAPVLPAASSHQVPNLQDFLCGLMQTWASQRKGDPAPAQPCQLQQLPEQQQQQQQQAPQTLQLALPSAAGQSQTQPADGPAKNESAAALQPRHRVTSKSAGEATGKPDVPLSDLEQAAFEALKARGAGSKADPEKDKPRNKGGRPRKTTAEPKAKAQPKAKPQSAKGKASAGVSASAAKAASSKKRPAACLRDYVVAKPTARQLTGTKDSYICSHYHAAKTFAKKEFGWDKACSLEYARKAYAQAVTLWKA